MFDTNFKSFAPAKDKTVTVTRKMTLAERKAEQRTNYADYVACSLVNYLPLAPITIVAFGWKYIFSFDSSVNSSWLYTVKRDGGHGVVSTILHQGNAAKLAAVLKEYFNLCEMARLLKLAGKQVADAWALKNNKPQPVKQKVLKKDRLQAFAEEYNQLLAKYPEIRVYGDRNGNPVAHITHPHDMYRTSSILL
jgi:hypothetical protein